MTCLVVAAWGWLWSCDAFPSGCSALENSWSFLTERDEIPADLVGGWFNSVENVPAFAVEIIEHEKGFMPWFNGSILPLFCVIFITFILPSFTMSLVYLLSDGLV